MFQPRNRVGAFNLNSEAKNEDDKESAKSSSDEKAESTGSDGNHQSPGLEKKKMKRFRYGSKGCNLTRIAGDKVADDSDSLTHSQTRFLMSEFTRQAHPNALHRERLSREIPGLTPRQVQVWFQNR